MTELKITLNFGGGADLLFNCTKKRAITLTGQEKWTIRKLIQWMHDNILTERSDLFIQNETIRPGILVLVNDTDWELLGELDYELMQNDNISFISTLHGG